MGLLVDGKWQDKWYDTKSTGGRFVRKQAAFRNWITPDGEPVILEGQVLRASLKTLTGVDAGRTDAAWLRWWREHEADWTDDPQ